MTPRDTLRILGILAGGMLGGLILAHVGAIVWSAAS